MFLLLSPHRENRLFFSPYYSKLSVWIIFWKTHNIIAELTSSPTLTRIHSLTASVCFLTGAHQKGGIVHSQLWESSHASWASLCLVSWSPSYSYPRAQRRGEVRKLKILTTTLNVYYSIQALSLIHAYILVLKGFGDSVVVIFLWLQNSCLHTQTM